MWSMQEPVWIFFSLAQELPASYEIPNVVLLCVSSHIQEQVGFLSTWTSGMFLLCVVTCAKSSLDQKLECC